MADLDVSFERFDEKELASFLEGTRGHFIEELIASGSSRIDASTQGDATFERLCPQGSPAPGQLLGRVMESGRPIGVLWLGPAGTDPQRWWVFDVSIDEQWRGKGYGRQAMLLAERLARDKGATAIGLNVFARNDVARSLYVSLGYVEGSVQMHKLL